MSVSKRHQQLKHARSMKKATTNLPPSQPATQDVSTNNYAIEELSRGDNYHEHVHWEGLESDEKSTIAVSEPEDDAEIPDPTKNAFTELNGTDKKRRFTYSREVELSTK